MPEGECDFAIGLVDAGTQKPAVRLAIAGRDQDGWYPLSRIEIRHSK
jgi:hypothetical protein